MPDQMTRQDLDYYDRYQGSLTFPETTSKKMAKMFKARGIVSVLDCGCGTGLYSIPLARQGFKVTGIDIDKSMVSRAKTKASRLGLKPSLRIADMTRYRPENKMDAIISMYNTIAVLKRRQFEKTLRHWHTLINDKGLLIFDVYNFEFIKRRLITTRYLTSAEQRGSDFYVTFHDDRLDEKNKIMKVKMELYKQSQWIDLTRETYRDNLQVYSLGDLKAILRRTGFSIIETHGGYSSKGFLPFRNSSEFIVIVAEKTSKQI